VDGHLGQNLLAANFLIGQHAVVELLIVVVVVLSTLAKFALRVGIGMALVSVSIGYVGIFVVQVGISEHGRKPGSVMEEPSGNGSSVAVEVAIGVAEDDDPGRVEVGEVSGDEDVMIVSVGVFGTKLCVVEGLLLVAIGLVSVGSGGAVAGVSKIGAVEQGLSMRPNGDQNLEVVASKPEHMMKTDSSSWIWAQVP